jgi:hypothetical protein
VLVRTSWESERRSPPITRRLPQIQLKNLRLSYQICVICVLFIDQRIAPIDAK